MPSCTIDLECSGAPQVSEPPFLLLTRPLNPPVMYAYLPKFRPN